MVSEGGEGMGNGLWWELGVDMRRLSAVSFLFLLSSFSFFFSEHHSKYPYLLCSRPNTSDLFSFFAWTDS